MAPGLLVLVPAMAMTGGTGLRLSRGRKGRLAARKQTRMAFIAGSGLVILAPAAIILQRWAASGAFDTRFYVLQTIELIAGASNLALMGLNIRDGLVLSGRLRHPRPGALPGTPPANA